MKNLNTKKSDTGQSISMSVSALKRETNLRKNSILYFQIGMILCLLGVYGLLEMQFESKSFNFEEEVAVNDESITIDYVEPFVVEKPKVELPKPERSKVLNQDFKVVIDDTPIIEKLITIDEPTIDSDPPISINAVTEVEKPIEEVFVPFVAIEQVPIYPGCEKFDSKEQRKKCMSKKISKLISKKFRSSVAEGTGLSGIQTIQTQFTINKLGEVTDVKTRATHPKLENEASRLINLIPKMKPGIQRQEPVNVVYTLPIKFEIRD